MMIPWIPYSAIIKLHNFVCKFIFTISNFIYSTVIAVSQRSTLKFLATCHCVHIHITADSASTGLVVG